MNNMPGLLKIFLNIGTVIGLFKNLKSLVAEVVETKQAPSVNQIDKTLESVQDLFVKKIIDIPDVDEDQIAEAIQNIRNQLTGVK